MKLKMTAAILFCWCSALLFSAPINWVHLSSANGDLDTPNSGKEQTSSLVFDIDKDGINDFVISERTQAPAVTWFRRGEKGWKKFTVEAEPLHIEAGSDFCDIDGDGDLDIVMGGDWQNNMVWWWENPYPDYDPAVQWKRYTIKNSGKNKHHDQEFGDFDGDFEPELVFWAQSEGNLYIADIPDDPKQTQPWDCHVIFHYEQDSEMQQRGWYPDFKGNNEMEGLALADIDGDGKMDIIGGGRWFKHIENYKYSENIIDAGYTFTRAATGQLIEGGRPEVILVVGDGRAPMLMYEWKERGQEEGKKGTGTWVAKELIPEVDNGHSIKILDFNGDGHLDVWNAEMRLFGENPDAFNRILLGDGKGHFKEEIISSGIANHESKIADLDGDGDFDVLVKPYGWETPRLDIWLQNGTGRIVSAAKGSFKDQVGLQLYSMRFEYDKAGVPETIAAVKEMGFTSVEVSSYYGNTAEEFLKILKKNGLKSPSIMFDYQRFVDDMDGIIREAKMFGAKYTGIGWIPHDFGHFTRADMEKAIDDFNRFGEKLKANGIRFFYHLHGFEFGRDEQGFFFEPLFEKTDPERVTFEMDAFWTAITGFDPVGVMQRYPGRFDLVHVKDLRPYVPVSVTGGAADETSVPVGSGVINFPALFREARKQNVKLYFIEDEAKEAAQQIPVSLQYLNSLK
ncbi:VCBS repeat-containing protein [candidate division KSB1 bacterium]|nr:VCBS repeat-containing protein [candidate division KSB1 bacterium]